MDPGIPDCHSLAEFQQNATELIHRLKESGKPAVLTVNGEAELVVQSAEAYNKLLEEKDLLESIRRISRGLLQASRGEGEPMRDFLEALGQEHGIRLTR